MIKFHQNLFGILILMSFSVCAQEPEIGINSNGIRPISAFARGSLATTIEGDVYLESEWQEIVLTFIGTEKKHKYPGRFNLDLDIIEVKVYKNTYAISWEDLEWVELSGDSRKFVPLEGDWVFGELVHETNDLRLLKTHDLKLKKANYNPALNTGQRYDEWVKDSNLVLEVEGTMTWIRKKKDVQKALQKTKYADKKLNISSTSESDLVELMNFLSKK